MSHPSPARALGQQARAAVLLVSVLGALLATLVLGTSPARAAQHHSVTIKQYMFMPRSLSIRAGDTITWTNQDSVGHDVEVTSGPASFHSPMLSQGQSWSFTFSAAGTYSYICSVHPDMTATVTVAAAPQLAAQPAGTGTHHSAAPVATAPSATAVTPPPAASGRSTTVRRSASHRAAQPTAAAPVATAAPVVTPGSDAALDPLLLVGGVAVAVVMFCLLLLTSRPERPLLQPADPGPARGDHRADPARSADPADATPTAVDLPAVEKVPAG